MTPSDACLCRIDRASRITDSSVVEHVERALDELAGSYHRASEKLVALEYVLQEHTRRRNSAKTPFGRFLKASIERRQDLLSRRTV